MKIRHAKTKAKMISSSLSNTHPEIASQWHATKNGAITPFDVTAGSGKKIWWKCPVAADHEWSTMVANRTKYGCPCCAGQKVVLSNCLSTTHPDIAAQWHPTLNDDVTPFKVTAGSKKHCWWKCPVSEDHVWKTNVKDRTGGHGCPYCSGNQVVLSNCLSTTHPDIAAQWHPTLNDDVTPFKVTAGSGKKYWWKCPISEDHEWLTTVSNRTRYGCPCCAGQKVVLSNCLVTTHPKIAAQWHQTKNMITPFKVTAGSSRKKVWWICPTNKNHEWQATVDKRTSGCGCPICKESHGEKTIRDYLIAHQIRHKSQWGKGRCGSPKLCRFDFAVERANEFWLIEYHGKQHYYPHSFGSKQKFAKLKMFVETIKRDEIKLRWLRGHQSCKLLTIPYWDFNRIETILDEFFNGKEPAISKPPNVVNKYEKMRHKIIHRLESKREL